MKLTEDQLTELCRAQMEHTRDFGQDDHWTWSDDGLDYCKAAFNLAGCLLSVYQDRELDTEKWDFAPLLHNFACDGICQMAYDLGLCLDDEDGTIAQPEKKIMSNAEAIKKVL